MCCQIIGIWGGDLYKSTEKTSLDELLSNDICNSIPLFCYALHHRVLKDIYPGKEEDHYSW